MLSSKTSLRLWIYQQRRFLPLYIQYTRMLLNFDYEIHFSQYFLLFRMLFNKNHIISPLKASRQFPNFQKMSDKFAR